MEPPPPARDTPEKYPSPEQNQDPSQTVNSEQRELKGLGEVYFRKVQESISSISLLTQQWDDYDEEMKLKEETLREMVMEVKKKEEIVKEREKKLEAREKEALSELDARDKELSLLVETLKEKADGLEKEEVESHLKLQADEKLLQDSMVKRCEELEVRKQEVLREFDAREKELGLVDETLKEKSNELEKKEFDFKLLQDSVVKRCEELDVRGKGLSLLDETLKEKSDQLEKKEADFKLKLVANEKLLQDSMVKKRGEIDERKKKALDELDARKKEILLLEETVKERSNELEKKEGSFQVKLNAVATEIKEKKKFLELKEKEVKEREEVLALKQRVSEVERSIQEETRKRSRLAFDLTDAGSINGDGRKSQSIKAVSEAAASEQSSEAERKEAQEIICIDDDPEPFECPDPDFNDFKNAMSSFSVGQVWAVYDPLDDMPRYYARIRNISMLQSKMRVRWLESSQTKENETPIPIACGGFKFGDSDTQSHLVFSHQMDHITSGKDFIINPRKGETWALFRDWTKTWNKAPYRYDFVTILTEFNSVNGIGVAYLGRVDGFTSVYKPVAQHGCIEAMIAADEMLKFSHKVPSFKLKGDEKEGVPAGSFELDPAAIPRAYLKAAKRKEQRKIKQREVV